MVARKVDKPQTKKGFDYDYDQVLDVVEKRFKLSASMNDRFKYARSSGLLVMDLMLGGGLIVGGMYTVAGMEQTAKSTFIMNFLAKQLSEEEPPKITAYFDGEGSFSPDYFSQMLGSKIPDTEIFGVKSQKGGYVVKPRIRYYAENRGELVMDAISAMLRRLPDKELIDEQWYYVFENTKENQKLLKDKYSKTLFSKYNKFYILTEDTAPQAIFVVDSWPALVTERSEDEDANGPGLGASARMFAEFLPNIKGKLRRKGALLLGVNQLREKPMAYGDPRYEPGGNALKFNSDIRIWNTARAVPHGKGQIEEEPSVTREGVDTYRYIHAKAMKNKLSTPYLEGWMRLWVSDADGVAHGYDKVYDTFIYLKETGQCSGTMKKLTIPMLGIKKVLSWADFKGLILLTGKPLQELCKKLGLAKNPKLRDRCFAQITKGEGIKLYFETLKGSSEDEDEDEEDD